MYFCCSQTAIAETPESIWTVVKETVKNVSVHIMWTLNETQMNLFIFICLRVWFYYSLLTNMHFLSFFIFFSVTWDTLEALDMFYILDNTHQRRQRSCSVEDSVLSLSSTLIIFMRPAADAVLRCFIKLRCTEPAVLRLFAHFSAPQRFSHKVCLHVDTLLWHKVAATFLYHVK